MYYVLKGASMCKRENVCSGYESVCVYVCLNIQEKSVLGKAHKRLYVYMAIAICVITTLVKIMVTCCIPIIVNKFYVLSLHANITLLLRICAFVYRQGGDSLSWASLRCFLRGSFIH